MDVKRIVRRGVLSRESLHLAACHIFHNLATLLIIMCCLCFCNAFPKVSLTSPTKLLYLRGQSAQAFATGRLRYHDSTVICQLEKQVCELGGKNRRFQASAYSPRVKSGTIRFGQPLGRHACDASTVFGRSPKGPSENKRRPSLRICRERHHSREC